MLAPKRNLSFNCIFLQIFRNTFTQWDTGQGHGLRIRQKEFWIWVVLLFSREFGMSLCSSVKTNSYFTQSCFIFKWFYQGVFCRLFFQWTIQWFLLDLLSWVVIITSQFKYFYHLNMISYAFWWFLPAPALGNHQYLFCLKIFALQYILDKWNHMICWYIWSGFFH